MAKNVLKFWKGTDGDPFRVLFGTAPIMMHSIDSNGVLIDVSQFWASKLGYTRADMIGRRSTEFLTVESAKYAKDVVLPKFYKAGSVENVPYDFVRRDGSIIPVLMSAVAQYDEDGSFFRSLAILFDNTEATRAREALHEHQRLEAIGRLVGGVAHDFNNLLTVIKGNLEFLRDDIDGPDRMDHLRDAQNATLRGAELTKQLLSYGRKANLEPVELDLNQVIGDFDQMVRRLLPESIDLRTAANAGLWKTVADPAQIEHALLNLANNAQDAMPDGGILTVETGNIRVSEEYASSHRNSLKPGRYVMLAITDTGRGMSKETAERATEPFFTTKGVGEGSGLGLSMAYGFLLQSGGSLQIYSETDYGTTVKMFFPAVADATTDGDNALQATSYSSAELMVVEDEADVRRVIVKQLKSAGYRVTEAPDGDTAFAMLSLDYQPRILITDIVMPGEMQGPELARRARKLHPHMHVIFVSGYPTEAAIHGNGLDPDEYQFVKPIDRDEFLAAIEKLLGSSR